MEKTSHFTYEEENKLIQEVCEEIGSSYKEFSNMYFSYFYFSIEPEFTKSQQINVMQKMCDEFGLEYRGIGYDIVIQKTDEDEPVFKCTWDSLFGGRPACSNLNFVLKHFDKNYEGSGLEQMCNAFLLENQKQNYKEFAEQNYLR